MIKEGDLVVDGDKRRVGRVMQITTRLNAGPVYVLRPPKGGIEWEARVGVCREAKPEDLISAGALTVVEPKA